MGDDIDVQSIVRIVELRGKYANGEKMLSLIPTKFKKKVWIRKGAFAVTEGKSETVATASSQVKTTIAKFLDPSDIKDLTKAGLWPAAFTKAKEEEAPKLTKKKEEKEEKEKERQEGEEEEESEDDDDDLFVNPNHQVYPDSDDEEEDDDDEEDE